MSDTTLADRALIRLSGTEVRGFLQGLVTNDLGLLAPDRPLWAGLLTPQGKVLFDFLAWDDGEAVLLDVEAARAEALSRRLAVYRLRRAVAIEPAAGAVHWASGGDRGVDDPRLAALGKRWLGAPASPATGWLAHRLSLGVIEGEGEFGAGETLWLEGNARELNGVSFTKGCYVGQENTARMHHRGKVNRRLVVAPLRPAGDHVQARYPALDLMVQRRRIEALDDALRPAWLTAALTADQRPMAV